MEGLSCLDGYRSAHAPSISQNLVLAVAGIWKLVDEIPGDAVAHIKIGITTVGPDRRLAVVRLRSIRNVILAVAGIINRMRPGVVERGGQAVPVVNSPAGLQRIVDRVGRAFLEVVVDPAKVEWARRAAAAIVIVIRLNHRECWLVQVAEPQQLVSLRTDVVDLQRAPAPNLLLQVQVVVFHLRSAQM